MPKPIFIHPDALGYIYQIPRGVAADITQAIRALGKNPTPANATPIVDRPGRHELWVQGYVVTYEVTAAKITILVVDPEVTI